jgi:hypothetical protein
MDFQEFFTFVPKVLDARLPAFDAHIKMAPLERVESLKNRLTLAIKPRVAAVMMFFYPKKKYTFSIDCANS